MQIGFAEEEANLNSPDEIKKRDSWEKLKKVALVVGVSKYARPISDLTYPDNDSQRIANALKSVEDYEVILMNHTEAEAKQDSSLKPTYENVTRKWKEITDKKPGLFLFYFSGHGFQDEKLGNAIALSDTELSTSTKPKQPAKTEAGSAKEMETKKIEKALFLDKLIKDEKTFGKVERTVLFIDACREKVSLEEGTKSMLGSEFKFSKDLEELWKKQGNWILLSTEPNTLSYEYPSLESGLFTHYLEEALTGGVQNESSEEYVTLDTLKKYLERKMVAFNDAQKEGYKRETPQRPYLIGDDPKILISTKRPTDSSRVEEYNFKDILDFTIESKLVFDQKGRRYTQRFFETGQDKKQKEKSLDGVGSMKYKYEDESEKDEAKEKIKFLAEQVQTSGITEFNNGLWEEEGSGWVYRAPRSGAKNREFVLQKFDYNGNLTYDQNYKVLQDNKENSKEIGKSQIAATLNAENRIATKVYAFDIKGKETLREFYDVNEKLVPDKDGIARYVSAYDTKGNLLIREYYDENGKLKDNPDKIARISNQYSYNFPDKNGRIILKEYKNKDAQLDGDKDGVATIEYKYTDAGKLREQVFKDEKNNLVDATLWVTPEGEIKVIPDGDTTEKNFPDAEKIKAARMVREYENEILKSVSFYRKNGKLKFFREGGVAKIDYKSEESTEKNIYSLETIYLGEGDTRVADKDGISRIVTRYDLNCLKLIDKDAKQIRHIIDENKEACIVFKALYDAKDSIVADKDGFGKQEFKYDSLGNLIYEAYYDVDGKLKVNPAYETPIAIQERAFDSDCLKKGKNYIQCYTLLQMKDEKEQLIEDKWGIAKYTATFESGNPIKKEYFDKNEKLKNHSDFNYAKEVYTYNKEGLPLSESFYSEKEELIGANKNYTYTNAGSLASVFFTGQNGEKLEKNGFHKVEYRYREIPENTFSKKNVDDFFTEKEYSDKDGKPVEVDGYWKKIEYSGLVPMRKGVRYLVYEEGFGADKTRKPVGDGHGILIKEWNTVGQHLYEKVYDLEGGLKRVSKWNEKNRLIAEDFYTGKLDAKGKNIPIVDPVKNYASMTATYADWDETFLVKEDFWDASKKPITSIEKGYASFAAVYDEKDKRRLVSKLIKGAKNQTLEEYIYNKDGVLTKKACFEETGKRKACDLDGVAEYNLTEAHFMNSETAEKEVKIKLPKQEKMKYQKEYFIGADGQPKEVIFGYATKFTIFSGDKKISHEIFLDAKGNKKETLAGCAVIEYKYNLQEKLESEECKDASGNTTMNLIGGAAKIEYSYPSETGTEKEIKKMKLLDPKLNPIPGISVFQYEFDKAGRKTAESYYKVVNGKEEVALNSFQFAGHYYRYDQKGNLEKEFFLGEKGEPVAGPEGVARFDYRYNQNGIRIMKSAYHKSGNLLSKIEYFEDGKSIKQKTEFNENGNGNIKLREEYYDPSKLMTYEVRDEKGFLTKQEYHLYFPNRRGSAEKRLIHLELDRYYRPISIEFVPETITIKARKEVAK